MKGGAVKPYNAPRFDISEYDFQRFVGSPAGQRAPDFELQDIRGNAVTLADFHGKWLVLEMGALTCAMYARNISAGKELQKDYPDVKFVIVYVREAHPGENIKAHDTIERKVAYARLLGSEGGESREILIDSIDGRMNVDYGSMPNSVYVIDPEGTVTYRCTWAVPGEIRKVLDNRGRIHTKEHLLITEHGFPPPGVMIRTFRLAGWRAIFDFVVNFPKLIVFHIKMDRYFVKHGCLKNSVK